MLNEIMIMGRLTKDPEARKTQNNTSVTTFSVAVDRNYVEGTDFFECVAWRQTADFAATYLSKGRMVVVQGHGQFRDWTDKSGQKRRTFEVIADNIYFADSPNKGERKNKEDAAPQQQTFEELGEEDGDLPF